MLSYLVLQFYCVYRFIMHDFYIQVLNEMTEVCIIKSKYRYELSCGNQRFNPFQWIDRYKYFHRNLNNKDNIKYEWLIPFKSQTTCQKIYLKWLAILPLCNVTLSLACKILSAKYRLLSPTGWIFISNLSIMYM